VFIVTGLFSWQGKILVGTKGSEFIEVHEKTGESHLVSCGHGEGELWGLATHPSVDRFITASDDGTVRAWDVTTKVCVTSGHGILSARYVTCQGMGCH